MAERDPNKLAESFERETDELARESRELKHGIDATREEWQRKRADEGVPGAPPPDDRESEDPGPADNA